MKGASKFVHVEKGGMAQSLNRQFGGVSDQQHHTLHWLASKSHFHYTYGKMRGSEIRMPVVAKQ
jgi:hypothetical protein